MIMNEKFHATAKHKDGVLVVDVDIEECTVDWAFLSGRNKDADVFSSGQMDIEVYLDNTWLPYEETHRPTRFIPKSLIEPVYKLFKKCGMRENDD